MATQTLGCGCRKREGVEVLMVSSHLSLSFSSLGYTNFYSLLPFPFFPLFLTNGTEEYFYCLLAVLKADLHSFFFSLKLSR